MNDEYTPLDLLSVKAPFKVRLKGKKRVSTVIGFAQSDPLDVGGDILPDMPVAYFKGGGWILLDDLKKHYELADTDSGNCDGKMNVHKEVKK